MSALIDEDGHDWGICQASVVSGKAIIHRFPNVAIVLRSPNSILSSCKNMPDGIDGKSVA
jgi:hypothetical protein